MEINNKYSEIYCKLSYETAIVVFLKKNGDIRTMLATRNLNTAGLLHGFMGRELGGHDNRCNITNGNLAIIDLILGQARSFNIERLIDIGYLGVLNTKEDIEKAILAFEEFKAKYEANRISVDEL